MKRRSSKFALAISATLALSTLTIPSVQASPVLVQTHQVRSAGKELDGNINTVAQPKSAALSYCPNKTDFSFLGNRCLHKASGTQFYGYDLIRFDGNSTCHGLVHLRHSQSVNVGPPAQTYAYIQDGVGTWYYVGTFVSSTTPRTDSIGYGIWNPTSANVNLLFAKSTVSFADESYGPVLNWHEATVKPTGNGTDCF